MHPSQGDQAEIEKAHRDCPVPIQALLTSESNQPEDHYGCNEQQKDQLQLRDWGILIPEYQLVITRWENFRTTTYRYAFTSELQHV
jgi:hypothetical protein